MVEYVSNNSNRHPEFFQIFWEPRSRGGVSAYGPASGFFNSTTEMMDSCQISAQLGVMKRNGTCFSFFSHLGISF